MPRQGHHHHEHAPRSRQKYRTTPLQKLFGAIAVAFAIAADMFFTGWGRSILLTALVFGGMVPLWQRFWRYWWFWVTLCVLFAAQVFLLSNQRSIRQFLEAADMFTAFWLALGEFLAISIAMYLVARWFHVPVEELEKLAD
jgi:hypothetical protein